MSYKRFFLIILFCLATVYLYATHQRAGEISYRHVGGLTYEFTLITYTYTPSPADRPTIYLSWGHGDYEEIARYSKTDMGNDISKNIYIAEHTFPSSGSYTVSFEDPNRNAGIVNIPNSVNIPFYVATTININPFLGGNTSPILMNPPIDNGCTQVIYYHNPGAYDPDGDSLSYSLVSCCGYEGDVIPGYVLPSASNSITLNAVTGDLVWDSPMMAGEYNIAILIKEWRMGQLISSTVRDMQITIAACNNRPPQIEAYDTCVTAGALLSISVTATDPNSSQVTLSGSGSIFELSDSPATFSSISGTPPVTENIVWQTNCQHVRLAKYTVHFKAIDNGPQVNLAAFKTLFITVVAPRPEHLVATPVGNTVHLSWQPEVCTNAVGYHIYKRPSSYPFDPDPCQTGIPSGGGYTLIGTNNNINDTTFIDDGSTLSLLHGNEYCYRVVALFSDGAQSYVSEEVCTYIANDAPLITHVDVEATDPTNGSVHVQWLSPRVIDTAFSPPYHYRLFRKTPNSTYTLVAMLDDTVYYDQFLNTLEQEYDYKVEFWGTLSDSSVRIECADPASSVFLMLTPSDRAITLSWQEQVPWNNTEYTVYRLNDAAHVWDSVATTSQHSYTDFPLTNEKEYCYYLLSRGYYIMPDTVGPLWNRSQRNCAIPHDNEPPEVPQPTITTDCENITFEWTYSNDTAAQDVYRYFIYYKRSYQDVFSVIDSFTVSDNNCYHVPCIHTLSGLPTITGCYAMSVIDSNNNLSALSNQTCFDAAACMDYRLPNIFSPNEDGVNDLFTPYMPYTNVEKIEMTIYNRWGKQVFSTQDPDINWDGTEEHTGNKCSDGTFFYVCTVYLYSLTGNITIPLHGTVTMISNRN